MCGIMKVKKVKCQEMKGYETFNTGSRQSRDRRRWREEKKSAGSTLFFSTEGAREGVKKRFFFLRPSVKPVQKSPIFRTQKVHFRLQNLILGPGRHPPPFQNLVLEKNFFFNAFLQVLRLFVQLCINVLA